MQRINIASAADLREKDCHEVSLRMGGSWRSPTGGKLISLNALTHDISNDD